MAQRYLLLRRNKQTGPYSIDDLRNMPLEPYDLIWADGISDSWKHPGEIDELRDFAPYMGNLQYNFNPKKPGAMVQMPTNNYESINQPVSDNPDRQETRTPNLDNNYPSRTAPVSKGSISDKEAYKRKAVKPTRGMNRKTASWAIPVAALLLIGIWVGSNWDYFPANESVSVPITNNNLPEKNGLATYEEKNKPILPSSKNATAISPRIPEDPAVTKKTKIEDNTENTNIEPSENIKEKPVKSTADIQSTDLSDAPVETVRKPIQRNNQSSPITQLPASVNEQPKAPKVVNTKPRQSEIVNPSVEKKVTTAEQKIQKPSTEKTAKSSQERILPPASTTATKVTRTGKSDRKGDVINHQSPASNGRSTAVLTSNQSTRKQLVYDSYLSNKQVPVEYLVEVDGNYTKNEDGRGVNEVDFTVYNRSGKFLKAISLEVQYIGKNNELLKKEVRKFYNISADGAIKIDVDAHKNAERVGYKVLYISSSMGDFYYEPIEMISSVSR